MVRPIVEYDYMLAEPRYVPPVIIAEPLLNWNKTVKFGFLHPLVSGPVPGIGSGFTPRQFEDNHTPTVITVYPTGVNIGFLPVANIGDVLKDESTCVLPLITCVDFSFPRVNVGPLLL